MCRSKGCVKLFGVNILEQKQDHESNRSSSVTSFANLHYLEEPNAQVNAESLCEGQQLNFKRRKVVREKRKRKLPWTEDEHQKFLMGLKWLGKGDWKGISKNFVTTRTQTQIASHAQKYFNRQASSSDNKNRRTSLFDMPLKEAYQIHCNGRMPAGICDNFSPCAPQLFQRSISRETDILELKIGPPQSPEMNSSSSQIFGVAVV
ncbi:hypothetical protein CUMW_165740 [Citrus unshiu]|uniref:Uncharacterized protein n=1 Tax=Citrus unshiu TaxID=55188 RepID=A0A2H5PTE7_CITUN|nr:hypothetical protein CUMW_165740 [Citrus unshiu]